MSVCLELVEGCSDCEREAVYKESIGHECGEPHPRISTMCQTWGKMRRKDEQFHRLSHEPERCEGCRAILNDKLGYNVIGTGVCRSGCCSQWHCPYCRRVVASAGPVTCPSCSGYRDPRIRRIRRQYRAKRKHW